MDILFGLFGLTVLLGIAWLFSNNKKAVDWKLVATGVALQIAFAMFVLLTTWGAAIFKTLADGFVLLSSFTMQGSSLVFGSLTDAGKLGFIFAFQVLPTVIFFAALMSVLYHLGVMQAVVRAMAWAITKLMRVSGAETTSVCASVFIGQTEAPLTVRPYIANMTESELLTMMIGGMAHIAGGVMSAYVLMLGGNDPAVQAIYAKHFLTASIMAAPATLLIAKILIPETGQPATRGTIRMNVEKTTTNIIDAAAAGAGDGLRLALNIGAMLLAFIALIALINGMLGFVWSSHLTIPNGYDIAAHKFSFWLVPSWQDGWHALFGNRPDLSLQGILGLLLAPIAWVIGVPWHDAITAGGLIGQKVVINEFVAYLQLAATPVGSAAGEISPHTRLVLTYALCGFANFSSIAIQIGGIGGLAPERRHDLARFGLRAVLGGSLATFMTATIAGVLTAYAS